MYALVLGKKHGFVCVAWFPWESTHCHSWRFQVHHDMASLPFEMWQWCDSEIFHRQSQLGCTKFTNVVWKPMEQLQTGNQWVWCASDPQTFPLCQCKSCVCCQKWHLNVPASWKLEACANLTWLSSLKWSVELLVCFQCNCSLKCVICAPTSFESFNAPEWLRFPDFPFQGSEPFLQKPSSQQSQNCLQRKIDHHLQVHTTMEQWHKVSMQKSKHWQTSLTEIDDSETEITTGKMQALCKEQALTNIAHRNWWVRGCENQLVSGRFHFQNVPNLDPTSGDSFPAMSVALTFAPSDVWNGSRGKQTQTHMWDLSAVDCHWNLQPVAVPHFVCTNTDATIVDHAQWMHLDATNASNWGQWQEHWKMCDSGLCFVQWKFSNGFWQIAIHKTGLMSTN